MISKQFANKTLYSGIADKLRDMINSGEYNLGDKLPSHTELEKKFNVSVTTIRQSLNCLEKEGILRREHGRGCFVSLQSNIMLNSNATLDTIGLLYERRETQGNTPADQQTLLAFADMARRENIRLLSVHTNYDSHQGGQGLIKAFSNAPMNGLCVYLHNTQDIQERLKFLVTEFPMSVAFLPVTLNETCPIDCVNIDLGTGVRQLMQYMITLGHRRIAYAGAIGDFHMLKKIPDIATSGRWQNYCSCLKKAGLPASPEESIWISYENGIDDKAAAKLINLATQDDGPTAIFADNDWMAREIIHFFWKNEIRVPQDISVAGFDDVLFAEKMIPELTTVKMPFNLAAQSCLDILRNRINAPHSHKCNRTLSTELVIRESVAPPRI